jgi:hypothetical protein
MSGPRGEDGFDDRSGSGWQEPAHLGEGAAGPAREEATPSSWEPPGWSLPPTQPESQVAQEEGQGGGRSPAGDPGRATAPVEDPFGLRAWAVQRGWTASDGSGPGDAVLHDLLAAGPVRLGREHRPAGVLRGRYGTLDMVAFDVVFPLGRRLRYEYAVTAAPLLGSVPRLRLSPARFWKHGTGGLLQVPSGDPEFDARWTLLAAEDAPQVRRLAQDPTVRGLLLGSDDGDEFWTTGTGGGWSGSFVAVVRPDAHRPLLLEHHARLLTAVVGALAAGAF